MNKSHLKRRWIRRPERDDSANKTSTVKNFADAFSSLRKLLWEVALICLLLFGLILFIKQVFRHEIILDPIEVPEDIAKLGFTGIVIAEQLADAALNIQLEARKLSSESSWQNEVWTMQGIEMNIYLQDIAVPGAPFSMRTISRFVRQGLGLPSIHLRGAIVPENDGLVLTLRNLSIDKVPSVRIPHINKRVEQLFPEGGRALLKLTNPANLAIYEYHKMPDSADQMEDYNQLVQLFEYCLSHPPVTDDAFVLSLWGASLESFKRPEEAIQKYEKAISLDPEYMYAYNGLGNSLLSLQRPEEAIQKYEKAISLDPKYAKAYYNWGIALQDLNLPKEAIQQYKKAISLDPKFTAAYHNWGNSLLSLQRSEEAIQKYEKAISLDPKSYTYIGLGIALMDLQRPEEAIQKYEKAISLDPKSTSAYSGLGIALSHLERYEEAIKQFEQAIILDPKNPVAYDNWSRALSNLKRNKGAMEKDRMK